MIDPKVIRNTVKGVLATFSSDKLQLDYQRDLPSLHVPGELYCQWFDDVYHPDSDEWESAFAETERNSLAEFSRTLRRFETVVSRGGLLDILNTEEWQSIRAAADSTLKGLNDSSKV